VKKVLVYYPKFLEVYQALLEKTIPEAQYLICRDRADMERFAPEAEVAFVGNTFPQELFAKMPRLEWVQVMAAGVESFFKNAAQFRNIPVCRVLGGYGKYMAEYVFAYLFFLSQDIRRVAAAQRDRRWDPFVPEFLFQKTFGIMGLGNIGMVVAEKAKALGMRVISWDVVEKQAACVDRQYGADALPDFLAAADAVVLSLPVTPATTNMIDRRVFSAMKQTAVLVNICRGAVVNEEDLVQALQTRQIAGAVIDVTKEEPLPPESPLWDCPNLIVSPHLSGPSLPEDMVAVFAENFRRHLRGEPLVGVIDFARGY
jgi:glyoxylate/hydroxypyruvate reductase A